MLKLSIIIPAYNIEKYIEKCIISCLRQLDSYDDFEILVIDDGSNDKTALKIKDLAKSYSNIKYIYQKNGGQAVARNNGVKEAQGCYIWFVDGDDYLSEDGIGEILNLAITHDLDLIGFNLRTVKVDGEIINEASFNSLDEDKIILDKISFNRGLRMPHSPCVALFKREFLLQNGLIFKRDLYFEDFEFTVRAYSLINKGMFVNETHYNYLQREGSTMTATNKQKNIKRSKDLLKIADLLYDIRGNIIANRQLEPWINNHINFAITQSLAYYSKEAYNFSELKAKPYYPLSTKNAQGIFRWKCRLMNFSLPLYHFIYKCLKRK